MGEVASRVSACALRVLCVIAFPIASTSCGDDDAPRDVDAGTRVDGAGDASTRDSGIVGDGGGDGTPRDMGIPPRDAGDAATAEDAGPLAPIAACDPACLEGERCTLITEFGLRGHAFFTCRVDPGHAEGEACDYAAAVSTGRRALVRDDCATGLACALSDLAPGDDHACLRVCTRDAECAEGEACDLLLTASITADPAPRAGVCRAIVACDPIAGSGCPAGLSCVATVTADGALATLCREPGDHEDSEGCVDRECGIGTTCTQPIALDGAVDRASDDTRCRRVCDPALDDACGEDGSATCVVLREGGALGLCVRDEPEPTGTADRPARVVVPPAHDGTTALPLLLALHGNPGDSTRVDATFRIARIARENGYYAVLADGTRDSVGSRFWNATAACCDFDVIGPDDSAYLRGVIDAMRERFPIDAARVWIFGTSNGGFMAHRLACDHADVITAIASRAGSTFEDASECDASRAVSALEVHGDMDRNVPYEGGSFPGGAYPGAIETTERWASIAGCDLDGAIDGTPFDLDESVDGDETLPRVWSTGCEAGIEAELWTLRGSTHYVELGADGAARFVEWMATHPR